MPTARTIPPEPSRRARLQPALACLLVALLALGACTSTESAGSKGYVSADGQVVEIAPDERGEPVELSGETVDGEPVDAEDFRGRPLVVPVWGEWCAPCNAEAPVLADIARDYAGRVGFLGVAIRNDGRRVATQRFEEQYDLPYESIYSEASRELLAFDPPPRAVPSLIVLDEQGRQAAVILGELPSRGTVTAVIDRVLEQGGPGGPGGAGGTDG